MHDGNNGIELAFDRGRPACLQGDSACVFAALPCADHRRGLPHAWGRVLRLTAGHRWGPHAALHYVKSRSISLSACWISTEVSVERHECNCHRDFCSAGALSHPLSHGSPQPLGTLRGRSAAGRARCSKAGRPGDAADAVTILPATVVAAACQSAEGFGRGLATQGCVQ